MGDDEARVREGGEEGFEVEEVRGALQQPHRRVGILPLQCFGYQDKQDSKVKVEQEAGHKHRR